MANKEVSIVVPGQHGGKRVNWSVEPAKREGLVNGVYWLKIKEFVHERTLFHGLAAAKRWHWERDRFSEVCTKVYLDENVRLLTMLTLFTTPSR